MRPGRLKRNKGLSRRAELRRDARLQRKQALQRGKSGELERKALKRVKRLARRSYKTDQLYKKTDGRAAFVAVQLQRYPWCELRLPDCWNRSATVHETWTRGRGGNKYLLPKRANSDASEEERLAVWTENRRQFLQLCGPCHDWIHTHPKDAGATTIWREGVEIRLLRRSLTDN